MPRQPAKNSLELKNLQAWIEVDGKKLDCYAIDIPNKRAREASCWIASEENKTFSVKMAKTHPDLPKCHFGVSLSLDGTQTDNRIFRKWKKCTAIFSGLHANDSVRHFRFTPLNVTDEEEYRDTIALRPEARQIGEITLRVHRATNLKTTKHKKGDTPNCGGLELNEKDSDKESVPQPQKVHESSLKASLVPHQISFGDPIPNKKPIVPSVTVGVVKNTSKRKVEYDTKLWYTKRECLATFTFRYRPLDVLVDGGIVPRRALNPDAESSEDEDAGEYYDDDDDDLGDDDEDEDEDEEGDEDMDTDDGEFRGSLPSTFNATGPRRASTRVASVAPNGNYADPDNIEGGDDSDIYVRTDEERAMREAQAQAQAEVPVHPETQLPTQPEGQAPTVATTVPPRESMLPTSGSGLDADTSTAPAAIVGQSNEEKKSAESAAPPQADQVPTAQSPSIDNQRQPSPMIRQESEEPTLSLLDATVQADGQPKDLNLSGAIAKEEDRDIKLEEIEKKVSPMSEDEEEEEERELRLKLEAIKERKRKNKELQRAEAAKRVKKEPENRFYFKPGEVVDLVSS